MAISLAADWMTPIVNYLQQGALTSDPVAAKKIIRQAAEYTILEGILYKRGVGSPMLRCLDIAQAEEVLEEVHGGTGSHHIGGKSLARKVIRAGYYWPTMLADAVDHVKRCERCQFHSDVYLKPPEELHTLSSPWPFYQWGMDIIGPFPTAPGQLKFVVVAIDYFTKWVEAEALATISSARIQKFFKTNIVARFGVPHSLVTDNGTQFTSHAFKELMADYNVKHHFSSVEHPQTNGQAEAVNRTIIRGIKKRLDGAKGRWVENFPEVLWSYRTTIHTSTGETPFRLTYGCEAVIPIERRIPTFRMSNTQESNDQLLRESLLLSQEVRDFAATQEEKMKQRQAEGYNKAVRVRQFEEGDLVLRRADIGLKNAKDGKLAKNWEGPYRISSKIGAGSYKLETLSGAAINNSWNAAKLKAYYS